MQVGEITQKLIDAASDAIVILDGHGHIRHFSSSAENLFGLEAPACLDQHFSLLLAPKHRQEVVDCFTELRNGEHPLNGVGYQVTAQDRQGNTFPMSLEIGEAKLEEHRLFISVCRDLSAERDATDRQRSAENLNRALFEAAVDAIITIDARGHIRMFNQAAESLFGYQRSEVLDRNVSLLMPDHYAKHHDAYIDNYLRTGEARIIGIGRDVVGQRKDGSRFPLHLSVGEAWHHNEKHFIGICHNLSDYHDALRKLAVAEKRYKEIVHSQTQMICRVDTDLKITFANRSFMKCLGKSHGELIGTPLYRFATENEAAIRDLLGQLFDATDVQQLTVKMTMAAPSRKPQVEWTFTRPGGNDDEAAELQGFGVDISEMEDARREADYLRNHDTITGLYNKQGFMNALASWTSGGPAFSVIHIDLENFGLVNQRHGFDSGNSVLNEVARRIQSITGNTSLAARIGADDFLVASLVSRLREVRDVTGRLVSGIGRSLLVDGQDLSIDVAIGVAFYPEDSKDLHRLPDLAESAMKDARTRRETIALFNRESHSQLHRRLDIEQALKRAIEDRIPHILLQPKYDIPSGRISGFEALVRWQDPELGFISPAEFIPLVEHSRLGQRLDRYVIRLACAAIGRIASLSDWPLPVAVNITAPHFSNPELAGFILGQLEAARLDPRLLEIELTEGVFLAPNDTVTNNLSALRKAGVKVAIDDFGTGYSSLSYLKNLQVDELKVDKSFTDEVATSTGRTVLQAVVLIAKAFGLKVTAEGVETQQQLAILEELGCDLAQGFLLSKPIPVEDACQLLQN